MGHGRYKPGPFTIIITLIEDAISTQSKGSVIVMITLIVNPISTQDDGYAI